MVNILRTESFKNELRLLNVINKSFSIIFALTYIILAELGNFSIVGWFMWGFNRQAEKTPLSLYFLTLVLFISAIFSLLTFNLFRIANIKNKPIFNCWNELKKISSEIIMLYLSLYFVLIVSILIPPLLTLVILIMPLYFVWPIVIVVRSYDLITKKIAQ